MKELKLIRSADFGGIECDFYSRGNEVYMTSEQLSECLGYADRRGVDKLLERNEYLKQADFSNTDSLTVVEGGREVSRERRIFTEDGIYEVTMLSKTEKAKEFRTWVRGILKSLRSGKAKLVGMTEYQEMMVQTRAENLRVRKAQLLERLANQYDGTYKQVLHAHATHELTGEYLLPLPKEEAKTYTAGEIAQSLGVSAHKVGTLANRHGLKTEQYGAWYHDKAKHSSKEVSSFRYFDCVLPVLRGLLAASGEGA